MILVVGATGNVGKDAIRLLVEKKAAVRALIHRSESRAIINAYGIETVIGDLCDPRTLNPAVDGVRKALLISPLDPRQIEMQGNFVKVILRAGNIHVVKLSGLATSLDSPIKSGRWHAITEKEIERSGLPYTFLRPPFFMQNILAFGQAISKNGFFESSMRDSPIAMIDARDVASIAVQVLTSEEHLNKIYNITGPEALSFRDVAEIISGAIGKPVAYHVIEPDEEKFRLINKGMPEWHVDLMLEFHRFLGEGFASEVKNTFEEITGKPPRRFAEFVREHASMFKDR